MPKTLDDALAALEEPSDAAVETQARPSYTMPRAVTPPENRKSVV